MELQENVLDSVFLEENDSVVETLDILSGNNPFDSGQRTKTADMLEIETKQFLDTALFCSW